MSGLLCGGDGRGLFSHQVQHQAEDPFRETGGDGDSQGQNGNQYKRFHWTCYRQVQTKDQWIGEWLGRNLNPGAFSCFDEKPGTDETLDDARGGFRGHLKRVLDIPDRQHRHAVVNDLFDHRSYDLGSARGVAAIHGSSKLRMVFHVAYAGRSGSR